ncbi:MAG TPA: flagellar biosynthesis anti-sigma factor FlgM [Pirellulales bacterium]|nr:flagellar biosynthesis anti-sigma factor FlgM [Pirellulales bacterium]
MQIHGVTQLHGAQAINAPHAVARTNSSAAMTRSSATADVVDISETGRLLEMAAQLPDIRSDRVAQLRAQIANGSYDTAEKLDLAVERLLDEIA